MLTVSLETEPLPFQSTTAAPIRAATIVPPAPIQATRIPTGLFLATRMTIADACPRSEGVERCAKAAEPMHVLRDALARNGRKWRGA